MAKIYSPSDLIEVVTHGKVPPNCDLTLQIRPIFAGNGVARGVWKVDEKFSNGIGVSMGGFLASAADIMMAYAVSSKLGPEQSFASIDLHTTFHKPVFPGTVEVEARVERFGKKVAYLVADLTQKEKKVASAVSSVMITGKDNISE